MSLSLSSFWSSLKTRVTLLTLGIFLAGIWSLSYYGDMILHEDLQRLLTAQQFSTVTIVAAQIDHEIDFRLRALENIAGRISPAVLNSHDRVQDLLDNRPLLQDLFNGGCYITGTDGIALASAPTTVQRNGINYSDRDCISTALTKGASSVCKPEIGRVLHTPVLSMAAPVRDAKGTIIGAIAGVVDLSRPNFLDKLANNRYGKTGGYILVAPRHKLFITGTDKKRIMQAAPAAGINPLYDRYVNGYEGSGVVVDAQGVEVMSSAKQIPAAGWFLVVRIPTAEAFAPIHDMHQRLLLITSILTILAGLLTWLMLRRQMTPLFDAIQTLGSLTDTNLPARPLPIVRHDEVGQLIHAFNTLLATVSLRESKLMENDHRHRSILQTAMSGIRLVDMQGSVLEVNRSYCHMTGFSEEELLSMNLAQLDVTTSSAGMHDTIQFIREKGEARFEAQHYRKDGSTIDVEISAQYQPSSNDQIVMFLSDITARKKLDAYHRMGQDILLTLSGTESLDAAVKATIGIIRRVTGVDAVGIRLQDGEDFPYFHQEGFSREFLQRENSLLARTVDGGICKNADGTICLECTCGMVISGKTDPQSSFFTAGGSAWTNDSFPHLHIPAEDDPRLNPRNECIHQGFASVALIPIRAKGRIAGLMQLNDRRKGCFTLQGIEALEDIAENIGEALLRKQAEEKLVASERFLRMLTDNIPGMVGYWTSDLRCRFVNHEYLEWFGKSPEQMNGISMQELMGEELFLQNEPYIRRALQGEAQHFERTLIKAQGETGHTWAHYIPDMEQDSVRGIFVLVSDVTLLKQALDEKVRLEAQLHQAQRMEAVGSLAGGVAHDFNNKLSVIIGYTSLAAMESDPDKFGGYLDEIRIAAEQSADLTRQLLAFARKQTIVPKVMDLNEAIASMLKMLQRLIGENIHLEWHPAHTVWHIKFDPSQMDQILANLCVNARDAITGSGTITIETATCRIDTASAPQHPDMAHGDYVKIVVSDTGCGMTPETQEHIFEPFFTTKELGRGTGLGLATVFGIVKQNSGYIDVQSAVGAGTTFTIYLPRHADAPETVSKEAAEPPVPRGSETLLLLEDEQAILNMTTTILTRLGYTVLGAQRPSEALDLARAHRNEIALLLTDVIMPEMSGKQVAEQLQSIIPRIRCLFMSGYTADKIAHHGILSEDIQFIQKPFATPDLAVKIREILDSRQD